MKSKSFLEKNIKEKIGKVLPKIKKDSRNYYLLSEILKVLQPTEEKEETKPTTEEKITYKVSTVVDGDTVYIIKDGKALRLRMIGIDAPESTALRFGHTEALGKEATQKLKNLIGNNKIFLEYDSTQGKTDIHGRDLVYIFVGNRNINQEMIESGYAKEYTYDKAYKYQKDFQEAEKMAKSKNLGIWEEKPVEETPTTPAETNYNGKIKGNISTKTGEKIYHLPSCPSYSKTRISTGKGERWFDTEAEAKNAGWRKAGNC